MSHVTGSASERASGDMNRHLQCDRYGDFRLTAAIRPSLDLQVVPRQGYRVGVFTDEMSGVRIPMIAAARAFTGLPYDIHRLKWS